MKHNPDVNPYVALVDDYKYQVLMDELAQAQRNQWNDYFKNSKPIHVEIGTGAGFHFTKYAEINPNVNLVGFEIKYKELIQSIRRAINNGSSNVWMVKADARVVTNYFGNDEIEKFMIHFSDPWPKRRHKKNRVMTQDFFKSVYKTVKENGTLEIKTDHAEYFKSAVKSLASTSWNLKHYTENLHTSQMQDDLIKTQFEKIFERKKHPVCFARYKK